MKVLFLHTRSLVIAIVLLLPLIGCNPAQVTPSPEATEKPFVFKITEVVDERTGELVQTNYLKVSIETGEEDPIEYEAHNFEEYRVEIPVGAEASVLVEATGYKDWELILRPKEPKYMEGPVKLVPNEPASNNKQT